MAASIPFLPKEAQEAVLAGPAMKAPDGVQPDFVNPPNENGLAHGVFAACLAITTLCLALRIYLATIMKRVKITEVLILCAFGTYIGWFVCLYEIMYTIGYFVHQWNLILRTLVDLGYWVSIAGILYSVTLPLLKVAILLEWTQLFVPRGTKNFFWYTCYALIILQTCFGIGAVVALNLICIPREAIWDLTVAGKCFDKHKMDLASAATHLITDIIMLFLPQKVIWGLQLSVRKKLGVSVVFSLGLLAVISAIFRLQVTVTYADAEDATYTVGPVCFWASAEMTCGFIISCMPSAPRLLKETRVLHRVKRALGMPLTTVQSSNHKTGDSSTLKNRSKQSSAIDRYRKIDEDGMPLDEFHSRRFDSSTEQLQHNRTPNSRAIMHTTEVTIKDEYDSGERVQDTDDHVAPWAKSPSGNREKKYPGRI